ncbi:MAG: hypothetical protein CMJ31_05930 [Phycisphaerae bacterium]|nr:hypothetical protein [Phycisphaerae bacterium]
MDDDRPTEPLGGDKPENGENIRPDSEHASGHHPISDASDPEAETSAVEPMTPAPASSASTVDAAPERIGTYRVVGQVGRGGMGSVYAAVRDGDKFKRRVAIKLMRRGMDTDEMLQRFELERQVLGALNHPNIARVFDAGATDDGRPYFVMEYVEGVSITKFCDENNLSVTERVELFRKVCAAVHEAHRNLVVHRDLKPSNILVNAKGEPKLLDFGIAKLLNPELIGMSALTRPEQRLLTYEYASPEQVRGEPITTASDVYALGVLLYEILVGRRPYDIVRRAHHEAMRVICEEEPERPSTAISKAHTTISSDGRERTQTGDEIARRRELPLTRLRRELAGDIDNIILMALRKSPRRRYGSALELADDLSRHVRGEPVKAGPDTFAYRASKFVHRRKGSLAAAGAVAAALVVGLISTAWQAQRATSGWREARAQMKIAEAARAEAEGRLDTIRGIVSLYDRASDRIRDIEGATVARQVLADALGAAFDELDEAVGDDPVLRRDIARQYRRVGELRATLGGDVGDGIEALDRAVAELGELRSLPNPPAGVDQEYLSALVVRAAALRDAGRMEAARDAAREAVSIGMAMPSSIMNTTRLAEAHRVAGWASLQMAEVEDAATHIDRSIGLAQPLALEESPPSDAHVVLAGTFNDRGRLLAEAGDAEAAAAAHLLAVRNARRVVDADPRRRDARAELLLGFELRGWRLGDLGLIDEGAAAFREAQKLARETLDWDPASAKAQLDFARVYENEHVMLERAGDLDAARVVAEKFLDEARSLAADDPTDMRRRRQVAVGLIRLGRTQYKQRDYAAARTELDRAVEVLGDLIARDGATVDYQDYTVHAGYYLALACIQSGDQQASRGPLDRVIDAGRVLEKRSALDASTSRMLGASLRMRGQIAFEDGDAPLAVEHLLASQTYHPKLSPSIVAYEAKALAAAGRETDAVARLRDTMTRLADTGGLSDEDRAMLDGLLVEFGGVATAADG